MLKNDLWTETLALRILFKWGCLFMIEMKKRPQTVFACVTNEVHKDLEESQIIMLQPLRFLNALTVTAGNSVFSRETFLDFVKSGDTVQCGPSAAVTPCFGTFYGRPPQLLLLLSADCDCQFDTVQSQSSN